MTTYSWTSGISADWIIASDWSSTGPPNAANADAVITAAGIYTVAIAAGESFLVDSLAFQGGGGVTLAVAGKLTLGGKSAVLTQNSGMIALSGTIAGGSVALDGGVLNDVGAGMITGAVTLGGAHGGAIEVASGETLTLAGAVTWRGGEMGGPGTVATTGTTTIATTAFLDAGLTWLNSGTVVDSAPIDDDAKAPGNTAANGFINTATGTFDITGDGFQAFIDVWNMAATAVSNAGLLEKTAGTGTTSIWGAVSNTGTITATSGTLELDLGGTLGGVIGGTGGGVVQLGRGPGFVTTGTVSILDAGSGFGLRLVNGGNWTDNGTIDDAGNLLLGNGTNVTLAIAAGGSFEFTSDDGNIVYGGGNTLSNAGLIAKVGGAGTSTIGLGFTNTGTVEAASGTLKLLSGVGGAGTLRIGAGSTLELASGAIANGNTIDFAGIAATLKLDSSSTVGRPLLGLGVGSRIELAFAAAVTTAIDGHMLTITPAGGPALRFQSAASLSGLYATIGSDGGGGTDITLTRSTRIGTGTTLDIDRAASTANVTFAGVGALQLDAPTHYAGTIDGLAAGDRIVLHGVAAARNVALSGSTIVVTRGNGATLSLATGGSLGVLAFVVTKDGTGLDSIITAETVNTNPVTIFDPSQPGATVDASANAIDEVFGTSAHLNGDTFDGFGRGDLIDFTNVGLKAAAFTWAGTASGGTLTISDGIHGAAITLSGGSNLSASAFGLAAGLHGGTQVLFI